MRGGSLTRYHTPVVTTHEGKGLAEELIKLAGRSCSKPKRDFKIFSEDRVFTDTWSNRGKQLTRGLKRKVPALAWTVGKNQAKRTAKKKTFKRATQRVRDIIGL